MAEEYDKFYGTVWKIGSGSLVITIPSNLAEFTGIGEGDDVVIMIKKVIKQENKED